LFEKEEANLALKHAEKCKNASVQLEIHIYTRQLAKEALKSKDRDELVQKAKEEVLKKIKAKKSSQ